MKKMKKIFAVILSLAMVLGMSLTAWAVPYAGSDGKYGTADDRGSIHVSGITYEENVTVTAYQIIGAKYENHATDQEKSNGTFSGYKLLYPNVSPAIELPKATEETKGKMEVASIEEAQLTAIMDEINAGNVVSGTTYDMTLSEAGVATPNAEKYPNGIPVGSYLVVIKGAETKVYNPVVASIYYTNADGTGNNLDEANFNIEESDTWVKISDTPKVSKNIIEDGELVKGNSVNIGDVIDYVVTIDPIPNYGGSHPKLNVVDTLNDGLTYHSGNGVSVFVGGLPAVDDDLDSMAVPDKDLKEGKDYTLNISDDKKSITVDFVVDGKYTLNDYVGGTVQITYSAILGRDAQINQDANVNDVTLNYSKDSKVEGEDGTDEDKVYSYTFDIDGYVEGSITKKILTKTGEEIDMTVDDDGDKGLKGAEFTLYTDSECTQIYRNRATGFIGSVESTEGGQLPIYGLEAGTYYLKETRAPEGYSLNTHVFKIEIKAEYDTTSEKPETGKLLSWEIKIDDSATSSFSVKYEENQVIGSTDKKEETKIPNTKLTSLPSTGGIGTTIFTIGGCAIMIIAAGLFFASRRKSTDVK